MRRKLLGAVKFANLPREICNHLHGEEHALSHRMWVGLAVMLGGVLFAHSSTALPHYIAVIVDMVGYAIHALGATPYIEWLLED